MSEREPGIGGRYDSYVVGDGHGFYLRTKTANWVMWNSNWRYATPMTKGKAEWYTEILKQRGIEGATHAPDAKVEPDYHGRKPE
jgi:hypothetical protein